MATVRPTDSVALRTSLRGYDKAQVDDLVSNLHAQVSQLTGEVNRLSQEISAARTEAQRQKSLADRLLGDENAIKETLITAQKAADEVKAHAHEQADAIIEEAQTKSEETIRSYEGKINDLRWELERLRIERDRFIKDYRTFLENHLKELNEQTATATVQESAPTIAVVEMIAPEAPVEFDPEPVSLQQVETVPASEDL